jgi:Lon protease-like protein
MDWEQKKLMDNKVFLFPLNNSILFKKVTLPYHIFESRYRRMVKDAIDLQIPIAVVPFNSENNYEGVICVAGIPHILTTYADGRMDIYITGSVKCKLTEFDQENPYKVYYYKTLDENLFMDESIEYEMESLRGLLERWAGNFLQDSIQRQNFSDTLDDPEILMNYCAVFLLDDIELKKEVMEAETMRKKIQIMLKAVGPKEIPLGPFLPTLRF